jgi:membrane-associated phospholipid phosphatase
VGSSRRALLLSAGALCVASWASPSRAETPTTPPSDDESAEVHTIPVAGKPLATELPSRFEGKKLVWDPRYTRVDALQVGTIVVATGIAIGTQLVPPRERERSTGFSFDESARNALRLDSYDARSRARDASDVTLGVLTMYPYVVDTLMVAYWYRGSADVAQQLFVIDAEAMAITAAIQGSATVIFGRKRPFVRDCGTPGLPNDTIDCTSSTHSRSFFSGHSSQAFVSASLICSHHLELHLYDSVADALTCAAALGAAGATAVLRVMGDMHYLSDVITGSLVGTIVGFGIPWLHHYRRVSSTPDAVELRLLPTVGGLSLAGAFR